MLNAFHLGCDDVHQPIQGIRGENREKEEQLWHYQSPSLGFGFFISYLPGTLKFSNILLYQINIIYQSNEHYDTS